VYTKGTFVLTDSNCQLGLFDEELELVLVLVLVLVQPQQLEASVMQLVWVV